jgi:hypothetical protein
MKLVLVFFFFFLKFSLNSLSFLSFFLSFFQKLNIEITKNFVASWIKVNISRFLKKNLNT